MLQRPAAAGGNGYSWWWASHIRTKQSKWLEQSLQDMEGKVEHVLNMIQKDGDSFAKRAEMYYRHRPEVISFVEETVRAYRSLAERYDKLSTDLQKANTTIASICPEKVEYDYEDDDEDYTDDVPSKMPNNIPRNKTKIPKTPKLPGKGVKTNQATKKTGTNASNDVPKSGLTKDEALEEINRLQKEVLGMQDESQASRIMVDDDAAEAALKSCEETLDMLHKKQEESNQDARLEQQRLDEAKQKLESLKHEQPDNKDEKEGEPKAKESLESLVSSQTALINMLRTEVDHLQTQIRNLEDNHKVTEVEDGVVESKSHVMSWQEMLLSGLEEKEKIQLLKTALVNRDREVKLLKQKLKFLQDKIYIPSAEGTSIDEPQPVSAIEERLRMDIDVLLDENLDFWLRFRNVFHQIHKFKTQVEDLQEEVNKMKAKGLLGKSSTSLFTTNLKSDIRPIYMHLKEINNELTAWLEESVSLKDELRMKCSSLSNIQEEITRALRKGVEEEESKLATHQTAKFQSEILTIKQENNKVNKELQAGLHHATALKVEIEKTLKRLEQEFGLFDKQNQPLPPHQGRTLRSFLLGDKAKKQKKQRLSFFACISHHKKSSAYKGGCM